VATKNCGMVEAMIPVDEVGVGNGAPFITSATETIRGHVFFCSLWPCCSSVRWSCACEAKGQLGKWAEVVRGLDNLHEVEAVVPR